MKIAILGAGAVGSYYGALLALASHEVVLIGRAPHVEAIHQHGLLLERDGDIQPVALQASCSPAALSGADLVLCCVKSPDTAEAASAMAPHLALGARVLSLQNGIDNAATLQNRLSHQVAAAVVYTAVGMAGPGHVTHRGGGELVLAADALDETSFSAFQAAGIPRRLSTNMAGELWLKLILNCAWNALSAISQMSYGKLWPADGVQVMMRSVVDECLAVAAAEGIQLADEIWPAIERIAHTMPDQTSSTAQDLARQRPTEIDHLNGAILRRAAAHGIDVPANRMLHMRVRQLEQRSA